MMRAAYLVEPQRIELRDEDVPSAEPGGLVVRVRAALTDGTDLKAYRRGHREMPMPTRFGHEFSGDVASVGRGVTGFRAGQGVMCVHTAPCGNCVWCGAQQEELCERVMSTKILGAYAEYVAVPPHIVNRNTYPKPGDLPYEEAAFLEPLACVVHSLDVLAMRDSGKLAVIGDGGFGILHAATARALGSHAPLLIGRHPERLALARSMGVTETIDARDCDPVSVVRERTGGRGADAVIECTGTVTVWEAAPSYVRRGGTVSLFGGLPSGARVCFDAARLHYDELRLVSPFHFTPRDVRRAYELLVRRKIPVAQLITARYALNDLASAFAALDAGHGIKAAILP